MFKHFFPVFQNNPDLVYLDTAASAQKPASVLKALENFYAHDYANVHRGTCALATKATTLYERAREKIADFFNVSPHEIVFTRGATESLNMIADGLAPLVREGDEILVTVAEHHANFVPWQQLCLRQKAVLKIVSVLPGGFIDEEDFKNKLSPRTKIAAFTHISNVLGVENPIRKLSLLARGHGAFSVVDGAQSAAHIPLDLKSIGCDFFVCSGHKLYGPTGIGVLYGKKEALEHLKPTRFGGEMIREVFDTHTTFADLPARLEAGTPPFAEAVALAAAIDFLSEMTFEKIAEHEQGLMRRLIDGLSDFEGIHFLADTAATANLVSFNVAHAHPYDIGFVLSQENICVRVGHHCAMPVHTFCQVPASLRVSLGLYNTPEDVDAFLRAFKKALSFFSTRGNK